MGACETPVTRLVCATPHLTTSYVLLEHQDTYELQVVHHHGTAFMPIHDGLITIRDLDTLSSWATMFKEMGDRFSISVDKSQCTLNRESWICHHPTSTQIGHLKVEGFIFKLSQERIITELTDLKVHRVSFTIVVDGSAYSLPMRFSAEDCRFN